jgi:putative tricarboxylic transport membrane protein
MVERLLALGVLVASGVYLANALPLPHGTTAQPGPGFFPLAVGVFGTAVALVWVASALRRSPAPAGVTATTTEGRGRVATTAALLVGFCLLLPWIGYPLVAFLFTGLVLLGLGARWIPALLIALASAVASHYLFAVLLCVPLPGGLLLD